MDTTYDFCSLLAEMIEESGMSKISFYTKLGIKKPYFYDILSGKTNPPPPKRQFDMIKLLKPPKEKAILFFNAAAEKRKEVPADVAKRLEDNELLMKLRENIDYNKLVEIGENENG